MDGTFKAAPSMFHQVYSIHAEVMGQIMPIVVALLPAKDEMTYTRMFRLLQASTHQYGLLLQPNTICIDFELAMMNTIREYFPDARIRGCLFHYAQALWRKVQTLGLVNRYSDDPAFNRMVRRASALPLVPPHLVDEVWMTAMNEVNDPESTVFMDYVTDTWVDNISARFPIEVWTQYDNIDGHRTNNNLEAWHYALNRELGKPHPNLFRFIEILQEEQQVRVEQQIRLLQAGQAPEQQRPAYRRVTERLVRLKNRLINNHRLSLCRCCGRNFEPAAEK